ncbi:tyrosine-type recombinase/integrase [Clostridium sp. Marseille-Q7071]
MNKHIGNNFLVCKEDDSSYDPDYISRNYRRIMKDYKICEKLKIPYIRFHDLIHIYTTLLLIADVNPKVVAKLMGHSTVSMTLNIYSHVLPSLKENAISKLENLLSPQNYIFLVFS